MGRSPVQSRPEAPPFSHQIVIICDMKSLSVGTFTKSILIEIAQSTGYLVEADIEVTEIAVPSSPTQFQMLERAEIDLAITSPDNVLAYRYLQQNPLGRKLDVRILGAIDRGLGLSLCYAPTLSSEPLTFGVDVPNSGFAFVGYELLASQDVVYGSYEVVSLGSTPKRVDALIDGRVNATILNAGNELRALSQSATKVADVREIGPYIGTVFSSLGKPSTIVLTLLKVINKVIDEILNGEHAELVINAASRNLGITKILAAEHYKTMLDPFHGLIRGGVLDSASLQTIIDLRNKYLPTPELGEIMRDLPSLVSSK